MEDENTSTAGPSGTTAPRTRSTRKKILIRLKKPPPNKSTRRKVLLYNNINKQRRALCRLEYQINRSRSQTSNENLLILLYLKLRQILPRRLRCLITKIEMSSRGIRGRRWSTELKIACSSLWQESPAVYKLLTRFTHLPSIRTLRKIHHKVPAMIGLNEALLRTLASTVRRKPKIFKTCVLLFDEIPLTKGLHYNAVDDSITGFEDFGQTRKLQFADRALVFMARGILANWKQPIAYYLSHGPVSSATLQRLIVDIVKSLQEHFFRVMAVVCDRGPNNRAALNALLSQEAVNEDHVFQVDGESIVTLWDAPSLLTATRDSLMETEVKFVDTQGRERSGEWRLFKVVYDTFKYEYRCFFRHLTNEHINVRRKRNVRLAAQVMSRSVGMAFQVHQVRDPASKAADLSQFLFHVNNLFDTFNARPCPYTRDTAVFRAPLQNESPHHSCWKETLPTVRSWTFWKDERLVENHVSDDWTRNIEAIQILWAKLSALGVPELNTRYVNLDALENFFHQVRLFGIRKARPNCHRFDTRLKASVLNEYAINMWNAGDREADLAKLLSDMHGFLMERSGDDIEVDPSPCNYVVESGSEGHQEVVKCSSSTCTGVEVPVGSPAFYRAALRARQVLKKLPRVFRSCKDCLATVYRCTEHGEANCLCTGVWPTTSATKLLWLTKVTMLKELKVKAHYKDLTEILVNSTSDLVYDGLGCDSHRASFVSKLLIISARMCMQEYIGTVNTSLSSL